jgi:5-oxoprolinase (ATP-hydrolysing)
MSARTMVFSTKICLARPAAPEALHAKDTILSGPAGGLVGAARTAAAAGFQRIVGFDMGGTSTDVCYVEGAWPRHQQVELGGVPIQAPMLATSSHATTSSSLLIGQKARTGERSPSMLLAPQPTSPIQQI